MDEGGRSGGHRSENTKKNITNSLFNKYKKENGKNGTINEIKFKYRKSYRARIHNTYLGSWNTEEEAQESIDYYKSTGIKLKNKEERGRKIKLTNLNTKQEKIFNSIKECQTFLGLTGSTGWRILNGKRKPLKDYHLEYYQNNE